MPPLSTHCFKMKKILGISAYYHDSAAALLIDGRIVAAAQEERFTRKKHDPSFPVNAVKYALAESGLNLSDIDAVAFYDKPYIKFERLLETYHAFAPSGIRSFLSAMPVWLKEKLFMRRAIWKELTSVHGKKIENPPELLFPEHHLSHGASAFYPSPFEDAAILTVDGVGEWATTTISHGRGNSITKLRELSFPHSLGLLYSAFTAFCGFKVNSGEYKLMGLAPYGQGGSERVETYKRAILEKMVDLKEDGSFFLNMAYFDYATGLRMFKPGKWKELFGLDARKPESELDASYMDLALALQEVVEDMVLRLAAAAGKLTGSKNLVMAGGVALNCVANGKLISEELFDDVWIQPAAGDAGGAVGAAYAAHHIWAGAERSVSGENRDSMEGSYLGPSFSTHHAKRLKYKFGAVFEEFDDFSLLCEKTASLISDGNAVGWFQGRMEWGPRALGNRSILADPRNPETQKKLNLKIKYREGFRPFAPSCLWENTGEFFDLSVPSPYMLLVAPVHPLAREAEPAGYADLPMFEKLYHQRSTIPAVTHVDYSARVQSVHRETNLKYWTLINTFKELTGVGLLVNTSFNVRGEPIVCTPEDAYRCFMRTEMEVLVVENLLFIKDDQPEFRDNQEWQEIFELD